MRFARRVWPAQDGHEDAWRNLINVIDAGNTGYRIWSVDYTTDALTGETVYITLRDWKLLLFTRGTDSKPTPLTVATVIKPETNSFPVPSRRLILTDTLRFGSFSSGIELPDEYKRYSLNNATGRIERAKAHATTHGFGFVQTTNTYVGVLRNDAGTIAITETWFGDDNDVETAKIHGWSFIGSFSCDMWRVTVIDPNTADILGGESVEKYLSSMRAYSDNVVVIDWPTDSAKMTVGHDLSSLNNGLGLPADLHIWAILHP